jgi:hypothetical protein
VPLWDQFIDGLREHGWMDGDNLVIDARWAEGRPERFATFADELVALQPVPIEQHRSICTHQWTAARTHKTLQRSAGSALRL